MPPRTSESPVSVMLLRLAGFTALLSEYLLQSTGLADPTVSANGAVGKTNSCNETVSASEAAESCFSRKTHKVCEGKRG